MQAVALAGADGALARNAALRRDVAQLALAFEQGLVLLSWRGKVAASAQNALVWLRADHPLVAQGGLRIFLGHANGIAHFALDLPHWQPQDPPQQTSHFDPVLIPHPDLQGGAGFADLRGMLAQLSALDGECAAIATALFAWHGSHGYCARCGAPSEAADAGWQRKCPACQSAHFPRTDPVVIMLVEHNDHLLLGRSPGWPAGMYSCLAGFIEPGEVIEAAVRREVAEETGVRIGAVRYLASQPWPFPASLMLGCHAQAISTEVTLDPEELEDAIWLSRSEVLQVQLGQHPSVKPARQGAIAHHLIGQWLAGRID